jgi:dihydrolipoamide dehydrogenase
MVMGDMNMNVDLLVIGAGPGGYAAAFRGADLGMDVALVDPRARPGGVCLYEGCIPSKTYLHLAECIAEAKRVAHMGVHFQLPQINLEEIRAWKEQVVNTMADGLVSLARKRGVQLISARAVFQNSSTVRLEGSEISGIVFKKCIIASGSEPALLQGCNVTPGGRIMSSTEALALPDIPADLLVIGGGYVGLEIGSIYAALGSRVHLVEQQPNLMSGVDQDLVIPLQQRLSTLLQRIDLQTTILGMEERDKDVVVQLEKSGTKETLRFDRVLVAVGRRPSAAHLGLETTCVSQNDAGFIQTDESCQTTDPLIFAVGDVCGKGMLAHTALRQGRVAAEAAAGRPTTYDVRAVPAVVYTDPQIAWCGLTEEQAKAEEREITVLRFSWKYSGRAQSMGETEGLTKILADPLSGRIVGVGISGQGAEGLISEAVLAIEMGAVAEDLALTLHPHPTLSETLGEAAEIFLGSPTHLLGKKAAGRRA